jgi:hypothetical protein
MVQREIKIEQLKGWTEEKENEPSVEVAHAISRIFLNGIHVGFVGHKKTDGISIIRPGVMTDKETLEAIDAAVKQHFKDGGERKIFGAPVITSAEALDLAEGRGAASGE